MNLAETYIMSAPVAVVGVISVDADGTPVEVTSATIEAAVLRKATEEPDVMPMPAATRRSVRNTPNLNHATMPVDQIVQMQRSTTDSRP